MNFLLPKSKRGELQPLPHLLLPPPIRAISHLNKLGIPNVHARCSICLTFDDGPDPIYTPKILEVLENHNAKATFFVLGEAVEQFPGLVYEILKAGHGIGNHTYSHSHPWMMSPLRAQQEVSKTNSIIKSITGITPRWFRPPFGRLRAAMRRQAHLEGMTTVLWSRSVIDWGMLGTKAGIARRLETIEPGDIVLMHDGKREANNPEFTIECLPTFLQSLGEKALVACTLDEVF